MSVLAFTKVSYPYGWLGNMAPYPLVYKGQNYRTSEALFQCLRFPDNKRIQDGIRAMKSPMGAKMHSKTHRGRLTVALRDQADLDRMELCLRLKLEQHPQLQDWLIKTGSAQLVEDCTARPKDIEIDGSSPANGLPFWGACLNSATGHWDGVNALGVLWMKLRAEIQAKLPKVARSPKSFVGHQHLGEGKNTTSVTKKRKKGPRAKK